MRKNKDITFENLMEDTLKDIQHFIDRDDLDESYKLFFISMSLSKRNKKIAKLRLSPNNGEGFKMPEFSGVFFWK